MAVNQALYRIIVHLSMIAVLKDSSIDIVTVICIRTVVSYFDMLHITVGQRDAYGHFLAGLQFVEINLTEIIVQAEHIRRYRHSLNRPGACIEFTAAIDIFVIVRI